jgi:uncharacterized membrane protein
VSGWAAYAAAWALFLASHALPVRPPVRRRLVAVLGTAGFGLGYSLVSVAALSLLIAAAGAAPVVPLWDWAPWQRAVTQAATLAACMVVALAALAPNPLSFGGWRNDRFDPARPGIAGTLRHPFLAALALWSAGHVPSNGDLAHALMFAGFAGFALLGMAMIDRRRRREIGAATWTALAARRRDLPPRAALRLAAGAALWAALVALHPAVIGPVVWP